MPYSGIRPETYGTLSYAPEQIESYMRLAVEHGFDIACHAIGDEANTIVLDCAERTHAHVPLSMPKCSRSATFRDSRSWDLPQASNRSTPWTIVTSSRDSGAPPPESPTAFNSLHKAGTKLLMGSDAPVAPLDPWLAISASVFGTESSDREPFNLSSALILKRRSLRPPRSARGFAGRRRGRFGASGL